MRWTLAATTFSVLALAAPAHAAPFDSPVTAEMAQAGAQARAAADATPPATPRAVCDAGSKPAPGLQGQVTAAGKDGYTCNTRLVSHEGTSGGFKVERFVDKNGRQCAYYDTTLLFPLQASNHPLDQPTGVAVVDLTDPAHPVRTDTLVTPAMQSPHESLLVNQKRGLLAAVLGNPTTYPGVVDVYDLNDDCRHPVLQSSLPVGFLGHESGFAPDGKTFYATSLFSGDVTAVDLTNPKAPTPITTFSNPSHGFTVSDDGNTGYAAGLNTGVIIVDLSQIQARKPSPQVPEISRVTWPTMTIPQVARPVTIDGKPYLVEVDEFAEDQDQHSGFPASNGARVGAARIIDISDVKHPKVVSDLRLEVNNPEHRAAVANDPGASNSLQGDASHYCNVPQEVDPGIVACSFIASGLRVFDIRDPLHPKELAYFVAPFGPAPGTGEMSDYAMSSPSFDAARGDIWYSDGTSGLYVVHLTNWPFPKASPKVTLGLPSAERCASRRNFAIRLRAPKGEKLRSARVYVNGRRVRVLSGKRLRSRVDLRGLPKGTVRVKVAATTARGTKLTDTRTYHTCVARRNR